MAAKKKAAGSCTMAEAKATIKRWQEHSSFFSDPSWRDYDDCVETHRKEAEKFAAYAVGAKVSMFEGVSSAAMAKARKHPQFKTIADATFKAKMAETPCKKRNRQ